MYKRIAWALVAALGICLVGCSSEAPLPNTQIKAEDRGKGVEKKVTPKKSTRGEHAWVADVTWTVDKWHNSKRFAQGLPPDETITEYGNGLLNGGITELLELLTGTGTTTAYNNASANIVVGNSTTAFSAAHTDMQGASTAVKAMDATYPQVSGQTATWKATYGTSEANFAWEEVGVKNGSGAVSGTILMLNRKVQAFGTKASGATWTMTLTLTVS